MTVVGANDSPVEPVPDRMILGIVGAFAAAFVLFGFVVDGPQQVLHGLLEIVTTRDALLTDYFGVGGIGGACVNAGLLTLCACFVYHRTHAKMTGAAVACLFLVLGFGLFGKNLLNVWSIVLGVYLYARFRGEPFSTHINTAFFGAALAPVFSEILFSTALALEVRVPLAMATGLLIGFILPPAAAQLFKAHMGFSLYNLGFTAGIVGTLVVAMYKSYGFVPDPVMIWTTGNNRLLAGFLALLFASMAAIGFYLDRSLPAGLRRIMQSTGQAPTDFIAKAGFGPTLANMALTGCDRYRLRAADRRRPQRARHRRDPDHRRVLGVRQASQEHRPDHARRVSRLAGQALGHQRPVNRPGSTVRNDAGADRRPLRLALGRRGGTHAFVRGAQRRLAACGPQPVQQRLCRRHRCGRARPGHHRGPGQARRTPRPRFGRASPNHRIRRVRAPRDRTVAAATGTAR